MFKQANFDFYISLSQIIVNKWILHKEKLKLSWFEKFKTKKKKKRIEITTSPTKNISANLAIIVWYPTSMSWINVFIIKTTMKCC